MYYVKRKLVDEVFARVARLEDELHRARSERNAERMCTSAYVASRLQALRKGRPEGTAIVSKRRMSWRRWFSYVFLSRCCRRVWEVQTLNNLGTMLWYSDQMRCLSAVWVAEGVCGGESLDPDETYAVVVRDVGTGRAAWSKKVKLKEF